MSELVQDKGAFVLKGIGLGVPGTGAKSAETLLVRIVRG
jgi:hypothetical protein